MIEVVAAIPKLEVEEELPIMGPLKSPFHQWENSFTEVLLCSSKWYVT